MIQRKTFPELVETARECSPYFMIAETLGRGQIGAAHTRDEARVVKKAIKILHDLGLEDEAKAFVEQLKTLRQRLRWRVVTIS